LFITGIPYAVDSFGQFQTTVYAVFCRNEDVNVVGPSVVERLICQILELNEPLRDYLRMRVDAIRSSAAVSLPGLDEGFNLAILTGGNRPWYFTILQLFAPDTADRN
jgi:hypothetical protein